jgi:uncharacterized protein YecA (UPF0149 family)
MSEEKELYDIRIEIPKGSLTDKAMAEYKQRIEGMEDYEQEGYYIEVKLGVEDIYKDKDTGTLQLVLGNESETKVFVECYELTAKLLMKMLDKLDMYDKYEEFIEKIVEKRMKDKFEIGVLKSLQNIERAIRGEESKR